MTKRTRRKLRTVTRFIQVGKRTYRVTWYSRRLHKTGKGSRTWLRIKRLWRIKKPKPKYPVKTFKMTVSSISYNENTHKVEEYEMYFTIQVEARRKDIRKIRAELAEKGTEHYRRWINKHTSFEITREVTAKFEREVRSKNQKPWSHAKIDRMLMYVANRARTWSGEVLASGKMRYGGKKKRRN